MSEASVQIPSKAVGEGGDISLPTKNLLIELNLLGTEREMEAASSAASAFTGPPQSVALIEAGATAAAKWWSAGLGASAVALWAAVGKWWGGQPSNVQVVVLAASGVVTAAVVIAIGWLISSDIRGRSAAAVAVIQARSQVAQSMVRAAQYSFEGDDRQDAVDVTPLAPGLTAKNHLRKSADEAGWRVIARERHVDGTVKYVLVKGSSEETVAISDLSFD